MKTKTVQKTRFPPPTVLFPHESPDSRHSDPPPALQTQTIYAAFSRQRQFDASSTVEMNLPKTNLIFCPHARPPRNER